MQLAEAFRVGKCFGQDQIRDDTLFYDLIFREGIFHMVLEILYIGRDSDCCRTREMKTGRLFAKQVVRRTV